MDFGWSIINPKGADLPKDLFDNGLIRHAGATQGRVDEYAGEQGTEDAADARARQAAIRARSEGDAAK